jgi:hypothetical protein
MFVKFLLRPLEHLARLAFHEVIVERSPRRQLFATEEQICHRVQVVGERECLVDRLDAQVLRVRGRANVNQVAGDHHVA